MYFCLPNLCTIFVPRNDVMIDKTPKTPSGSGEVAPPLDMHYPSEMRGRSLQSVTTNTMQIFA